ncbi:MAG: succinate--CoA ligase subunit alpha [Promicromonosporaceae bacterium]|nr:succinate--CoA ligase subunit alpha [Promicromonosporaceae bacterium]
MAIFCDQRSRIVVQGITGRAGAKHTSAMLAAGSNVVGGVNPRKAGTLVTHPTDDGDVILEVFGSVKEAMAMTDANVSVVFVPAPQARDAVIEAIDAGMPLVVVITEGIPIQDVAEFVTHAQGTGSRVIGPNSPGIITPAETLAGIFPADLVGPGPIGVVSTSGALTFELMYELRGIGVTTAVGIGSDPIAGTTYADVLAEFERDPDTLVIALVGEIDGRAEEQAAAFIAAQVTKPVIGYVPGLGAAPAKRQALEAAGVWLGNTPTEAATLIREVLATRRCAG